MSAGRKITYFISFSSSSSAAWQKQTRINKMYLHTKALHNLASSYLKEPRSFVFSEQSVLSVWGKVSKKLDGRLQLSGSSLVERTALHLKRQTPSLPSRLET